MRYYLDNEKCNDFLLSLNLVNGTRKGQIKKLYSVSNNIEKNYRTFKIKKRNGGYRTIYEPSYNLKMIQKNILNNVLSERKISKYARAYIKGISLADNAMEHVNKKKILKLDIENFFESIDFMNVYNHCFPNYLFPKSVGILLTYLCTYDDYLPQGAPTSAYISNLVLREFDEEIGKWCEINGIAYTRYSDDMTFSGDFNHHEIIRKVRCELYKLGLTLNNKKIHVVGNFKCQNVTGIVVNEKVQVSRFKRREIRKDIYYIRRYGLDEHLARRGIADKEKYLNSLYGKILFVLQINPNDRKFMEYKELIYSYKMVTIQTYCTKKLE